MLELKEDSNIVKKIAKHCNFNKKEESCGFITIKKDELNIFECENDSENPKETFKISAKDYMQANRQGRILGVYHSHLKENKFSGMDKQVSRLHNLPFIIYHIPKKELNIYIPEENENKLIGVDFELGINDCYSMVKKYLKMKKDIFIKDYKRESGWYKQDLISKYFKEEGFVKIDDEEPYREDDMLVLSYYEDVPTHILIYIGNNVVLHHPNKRVSCFSLYTNAQKKRLMYRLRHKECLN